MNGVLNEGKTLDTRPAPHKAPISVSAWVGIALTVIGMLSAALISYGVSSATTTQHERRIGSAEISITTQGKTVSDIGARESIMQDTLRELRVQQAADHDNVTAVKAVLPGIVESLGKIQRSVDRIEARQR